jgi:hypothetical protein
VIYWGLAAAITLASFAIVACVASIAMALLAPVIARRVAGQAAGLRAAELFRARALPAAAGFFAAFAIVLPVFLWFEPRNTQEPVATTLAVAAAFGAFLLARGAWRGVLAWRATRRLAHEWRCRGSRVHSLDLPLPAFVIDEPYPLVAVVGFWRPQLFISARVLRACSPDEVRAMALHECAHVAARDNIKRFVLRVCPDLVPASRELDALWANAAEEAADAAAAAARPDLRLDLAHALVSVARLAPAARRPMTVSAFYAGGSIDARVRRLLEPAEPKEPWRLSLRTASLVIGAATIMLAVTFGPALHDAFESLIAFLP